MEDGRVRRAVAAMGGGPEDSASSASEEAEGWERDARISDEHYLYGGDVIKSIESAMDG